MKCRGFTLALLMAFPAAAHAHHPLHVCLSEKAADYDDRLTPADVVARVVLEACRPELLALVKTTQPGEPELAQDLMALDLQKSMLTEATGVVLARRVSLMHAAGN